MSRVARPRQTHCRCVLPGLKAAPEKYAKKFGTPSGRRRYRHDRPTSAPTGRNLKSALSRALFLCLNGQADGHGGTDRESEFPLCREPIIVSANSEPPMEERQHIAPTALIGATSHAQYPGEPTDRPVHLDPSRTAGLAGRQDRGLGAVVGGWRRLQDGQWRCCKRRRGVHANLVHRRARSCSGTPNMAFCEASPLRRQR